MNFWLALRQLLRYMEHTRTENAVNETLKRLDRMVRRVKSDGEVTWKYMKVLEWEEACREEGRAEGRLEGRMEGREEERRNTERERIRAEEALKENAYLKAELKKWRGV